MCSSSISISKKELEKKRTKKMSEKEERKINSGIGSLENMIAYVDKNGIIPNIKPEPDSIQEIGYRKLLFLHIKTRGVKAYPGRSC